jgi:predicted DNA-binding transcriptional regulator AlpA
MKNQQQLVYRIKDLATTTKKLGLLPVSAATLWRWVKDEKFPKPFKLGEATTVWDASDVHNWIKQQKEQQ